LGRAGHGVRHMASHLFIKSMLICKIPAQILKKRSRQRQLFAEWGAWRELREEGRVGRAQWHRSGIKPGKPGSGQGHVSLPAVFLGVSWCGAGGVHGTSSFTMARRPCWKPGEEREVTRLPWSTRVPRRYKTRIKVLMTVLTTGPRFLKG
jgi:hypothetical protein